MAFQRYELTLLLIGLLPVFIAVGAALLVVIVYIARSISTEDATQVGLSVGVIFLLISTVVIFIHIFCWNIRPTEAFTNPLETLVKGVLDTEIDICKLITRTDQYIQSDVGTPGQHNPALVTQAQQNARTALPGPITTCPSPVLDISDASILDEIDNRLTRMETTLNAFTGPKFQDVYNRTVHCEGFTDSITNLTERLVNVQKIIQEQQTRLLHPIDQKNQELQKGQASDCDKRRGAATASRAIKHP